MGFSEKVKIEVKEKAAFRCCICQNIIVQVHHIKPTKDGGSDDIENAAPLCPNCHDYFGDNPSKRKGIKQMRDWWYIKAKKMFPDTSKNFELLKKIDSKLEKISKSISDQDQKWVSEFSELKLDLKEISTNVIDKIRPEIAPKISLEISKTFSLIETEDPTLYISSLKVICPQCNYFFEGYNNSLNYCPNCNFSFYHPEKLTYEVFKQHLSEISNKSFNNLSLDAAPKIATGLIDTAFNLETLKPLNSSKIICPKCNHEFPEFGYSITHRCPNCNHIFSFYKNTNLDI